MLNHLIARIGEVLRREAQAGDALPGLASDVGYAPANMTFVGNVPHAVARRMGRMATIFGAGRTVSLAERWRRDDMMSNCVSCDARRACKTAQRRTDIRPDDVDFCPNAENYRLLASRCGVAS